MKRREFLKSVTGVAAGAMVPAPAIWSAAKADARSETLLIVSESGPNNLDIHGVGTNVPGYEVSWNCYDRLISHEMKSGPGGVPYYDRDKFKPELAEDMNVGDMSVTFKLKKNAKFHDGTPVAAKDVKWSLDRAVSVGGFPTFQMGAGSLTKPEQFVIVDDNTVRVDFAKKDRLTVPDLAVIVPCVINSELVKKNASEKDPWGLEYTKQQTAGSGAYKVTKWTAGTEVIMERNDDWVGGPMPKVRRVIWRMVPQAGNRRALLERGDADISYDLPNKDFVELKDSGKLNIVSVPYSNGVQYIGMNVKNPPFDNIKVRQAVAYAIPYQKIMDAVLFGLAKPMFGAPAGQGDRGGVAASRPNFPPTSTRPRRCWRRPVIPTASRPRFRSILDLPASMSRFACCCRRVWRKSESRPRSTRFPAPTGAPSSTRKCCRSTPTCSPAGSTIPNTSSSGATTARIRSSTP